jgi:hypothetical protein
MTGTAGTTGTGGGTGSAGTTGTAGTMGTAGRGGSGGAAGSGGTAGTMGTAGRGGSGGAAGSGGAGGTMNSCPAGNVLDCSATGAVSLAADGLVTDFSSSDWNAVTGKWCDVHGLDGTVFAYSGTGSTAAVAVDTAAPRNLKLNFTVTAGQYAGGGLIFDSCVNAMTFNAVQFTAAVSAGSLSGCAWQVQVQTLDERPSTEGGTCASSCYQYPAYTIAAAPPATPMTFTAPFAGFTNPGGSTTPTRTQIIGLQWQANSSGGSGTCTVELRIDDIKFITQ